MSSRPGGQASEWPASLERAGREPWVREATVAVLVLLWALIVWGEYRAGSPWLGYDYRLYVEQADALQSVGAAAIYRTDEAGRVAYEVEIRPEAGGRVREVFVDGLTGELLAAHGHCAASDSKPI